MRIINTDKVVEIISDLIQIKCEMEQDYFYAKSKFQANSEMEILTYIMVKRKHKTKCIKCKYYAVCANALSKAFDKIIINIECDTTKQLIEEKTL